MQNCGVLLKTEQRQLVHSILHIFEVSILTTGKKNSEPKSAVRINYTVEKVTY